ncbi:hypothetical protein [Curtobacterium sp. Leaf261]|uniref:hypothetical protein n=1 Tax=Curtobacterium sp. Leaf261 TaxID=1736311 RepID=UPI000701ED21|nr:hypothetical protein [Curtobacterium sp. Leaf261]KQO63757.1 hypothetical protein ASF23_05950 [Curtobacterium sp. Leaf261]
MNGTSSASGYYEQPGGTGTAPTYSVQPADGQLTAGQWSEMDFNATAGGSRTFATAPASTGLTAGDVVLLCATVEIIDVAGGYLAAAAAGTAGCSLLLLNQNAVQIRNAALSTLPTLTPGVIALLVTIPSGTTSLIEFFTCTLPTGQHAKFRIGAWDVLNLTKLGLDTITV